MKVYIVRHGQVPHNALNQYNTRNEDLNIVGVQEAEKLRDKIKNINFDVIISSPLIRAKHTANIINTNNNEIRLLLIYIVVLAGIFEAIG